MKSKRTLVTRNKILLPFAMVVALTAARTASADYAGTILSNNPTAFYRFNDPVGSATCADSSGNNATATVDPNNEDVFPELGQPGIETNSILFFGGTSSDYGWVDVPASQNVTPVGGSGNALPFSCEIWVKPTAQPADYSVPIEDDSYGVGGWNIYVTGAAEKSGTSYFVLNAPTAGEFLSFNNVPITFPSPWYHLVVTYDATNFMFYINGVANGPYSGSGYVPNPGVDVSIGSGQNIGWLPYIGNVDDVAFYTNVLTAAQVETDYQVGTNSFTATDVPPSIAPSGEPASTTNYSGTAADFFVSGDGTLPFHYQWYENSNPIGGNSSALSFICQYPADYNASITVVITNNYGSITSSVATLTVATNENIISPPGSILRNVGSFAAFHVTANGALPITYQWSQSINNGTSFTPITGATNDTLWLSNVQLSQNNNQYSATVSGPFSSSTASPATLNVQTRPANVPPLSGYGSIVAADNPVAFWRLDEAAGASTAVDAVGSFNGTYTPAAGTIVYGLPTGIPHDSDPAVSITNGATIQIPFAPELNPETAWSAEVWFNPGSLGLNGNDYRVLLSSEYNEYPFPYNGWYIYQEPAGNIAFAPEPGNIFVTSTGTVMPGSWYHVVITDDTTNYNLYLNGVLAVAPVPVAGDQLIPNGSGINPDGSAGITPGLGNTVIGLRTDDAFNPFEGIIGDAAIYNYALTPQQIKNHFLDTTEVSIVVRPNGYVITWPVGNLQSSTTPSGPYTTVVGATSPYTNTPTGQQKCFRVQVP
jgi:heat shock protein HspQ